MNMWTPSCHICNICCQSLSWLSHQRSATDIAVWERISKTTNKKCENFPLFYLLKTSTKILWHTMEYSTWRGYQMLFDIPSNLCNQYAPHETAIMVTQPRSIFRWDARCHLSVSVYRPSSTNNQAVKYPASTTYQDDLFWGLKLSFIV